MSDELLKGRAWVEINLANIGHNLHEIKKIVSEKSNIMTVVKANAYGHGLVEVAQKLSQLGITDFAVATLQEGIQLRENHITGNILILGYTDIKNIHLVTEYDLIQTVVDEQYAKSLRDLSLTKKLNVHLKINTGMNRIGINYKNIQFIKNLYCSNAFNVLGIFSHFCVADSATLEDIQFSKEQISRFDDLIQKLKDDHIDTGFTHLQSSYGILNYHDSNYDFVRAGIILYGIHSEKDSFCLSNISLKPALSLYARITGIKEIEKDDTVSYGRKYKATKKEKIATVSIGYADGYPRNLSGKHVKVLVNGKEAEVIGRICMDQLMICVTDIDNVKPGDIVTLIGEQSCIRAEEIAEKAETITNELLSRLGSRLNYMWIDE